MALLDPMRDVYIYIYRVEHARAETRKIRGVGGIMISRRERPRAEDEDECLLVGPREPAGRKYMSG